MDEYEDDELWDALGVLRMAGKVEELPGKLQAPAEPSPAFRQLLGAPGQVSIYTTVRLK